MKISATIGFNELDFEIIPPDSGSDVWIGKKQNKETEKSYLSFKLENGIILDLNIDSEIDTEPGIIIERLLNVIREYNENHQMGFETEENSIKNNEEKKPYDPEQIRVRPMVLSAFQVHRDIQKGKIDLNPEFQRNFVWNDKQKSLLIESMLLKIPLPAFYFAEDKSGNFQVVDGLQRLTVINQFLNNGFKLKDLEYLNHLEGLYFSTDIDKGIRDKNALFDPYDSRVESTQLNINVIEASSPLRVKYDIFYRINTGGRPLNRQEIRNCFATNKMRNLLKRMANNQQFKEATGYSINDIRMDGQELALRFLGFHLYKNFYTGEMNSFLDDVLDLLNDMSTEKLNLAEFKFYNALTAAYHLFGEYSFRKCLPVHLQEGQRRQFLNKAMFIAWTTLLGEIDLEIITNKPPHEFTKKFAERLLIDYQLYDALTTGTTDVKKLDYVFTEFKLILNDYLTIE